MKYSALPSSVAARVAARLLDFDARAADLETAAKTQEARIEQARAVINGKKEVSREEYAATRTGFDVLYAYAQAERQRADTATALLRKARTWVEQLSPDALLSVVPAAVPDLDLAAMQAKLQAAREELRRLQAIVVPADDIADKVQEYVRGLAAQPRLEGLGAGQQLSIRWPVSDQNALCLTALLQPDKLTDALLREIKLAYPTPKAELEKRKNDLSVQIDELSYVVAAMQDMPDPHCEPRHWLGVRIDAPVNGKAAKPRTEAAA